MACTYNEAMSYQPTNEEMQSALSPIQYRQAVEMVNDIAYKILKRKTEGVKSKKKINQIFQDNFIKGDSYTKEVLQEFANQFRDLAQDNPQKAIEVKPKFLKILELFDVENPPNQNEFLKDVTLEFRNREYEITIEEIEADETQPESWQIDINEVDQFSKLSQKLKVELASIKQMHFVNGELVPKLGFLNNELNYPIGTVFNAVHQVLGNSQDPDVYDYKIDLNKNHPIIAQLFRDDNLKTDIFRHIAQNQHYTYLDFIHYQEQTYNEDGTINREDKSITVQPNSNTKKSIIRRQLFNDIYIKGRLIKNGEYNPEALLNEPTDNIIQLYKDYGLIPDSVETNEQQELLHIHELIKKDLEAGRDIFGLTNDPKINRTTRALINFSAKYSPNTISLNHRNANNKNVYEINRPNYLSRFLNTVKYVNVLPEVRERFSHLLDDPYYSSIPLLEEVINGNVSQVILNSTRERGEQKATEYKSMNARKLAIQALSAFLLSDNNTIIIPNAIHSDAGVQTAIKVKLSDPGSANKGKYNTQEIEQRLTELARWERNYKRHKLENDNKHVIFPFLNDVPSNKLGPKIMEELEKQFKDYLKYLKKLNIVVEQDGKLVFDQNMFPGNTPAAARQYFYHHVLFNAQSAIMLNGDPSFYAEFNGNYSPLNAAYFKRTKQIWSPVSYLMVGARYKDLELKEKFNVVILKEIETFNQEFQNWLEEHYPEQKEKYKNISLTDAQSYIDPIRYKQQSIGLGEWNDEVETAYQSLLKGETNEDLGELFGPQKSFYFNFEQLDGRAYPFQNKDSEFILLPVFGIEKLNGKDNPLFNPMYKWMLEKMGYEFTKDSVKAPNEQTRFDASNGLVDKFTFDSAVKVGKHSIYDTNDIIKVSNSSYDFSKPFNEDLNKKLQNKLKELYPEIEVQYVDNIEAVQSDNVFNQEEYNNQVQYRLRAVEKLTGAKARRIWDKGKKNNWSLSKTLTELQIPKEQKQMILDIVSSNTFVSQENGKVLIPTLDDIVIKLLKDNSFVVEVNETSKPDYDSFDGEQMIDDSYLVADFYEDNKSSNETPSDYYQNLTVPGGTNYRENEIATPAIKPNIIGHARFSTDNGIGWFRSDNQEINLSFLEQQGIIKKVPC